MSQLSDAQVAELSADKLQGQTLRIVRGASRGEFTLLEARNRGMKGVVWRGKDDLGADIAIKFVPADEYREISLIDEMTEASKLGSDYFATVKFFGDAKFGKKLVRCGPYKCIVTEWVEARSLKEFLEDGLFSVPDFIAFAERLFSALAILKDHRLCHDDLHPGNVLLHRRKDPLYMEAVLSLKVIDTGTIKRIETRDRLLNNLQARVNDLERDGFEGEVLENLRERLRWKRPDDHLRAVECLLCAANALVRNYYRFEFAERKFVDQLSLFFGRVTDTDLERRLDSPRYVVDQLRALILSSRRQDGPDAMKLSSPFDYISAEMIINDKEFSELFSKECPWLDDCRTLEPLYIYGPRGCGKSSVLRWLSFKTLVNDSSRQNFLDLKEVGVYVSCSVELRSRFWLLKDETIEILQAPIIRFFSFLLIEALFDTLGLMATLEAEARCDFGLTLADQSGFVRWVIGRMAVRDEHVSVRLQGQGHFVYLKGLVRKLRWSTWTQIQRAEAGTDVPDPSLVTDVCRILPEYFTYFQGRHVTFLIDDYSNQRIPVVLQRKLNQTISFAKQGTPIFKVSSEYHGVDLDGIQEGREVVEINVGGKYTSLSESSGADFLADIVNIRLRKAGYRSTIGELLGDSVYKGSMAKALVEESDQGPFYYYGIDTVHALCSGDVALALDLIRKIFERCHVEVDSSQAVPPHEQHMAIQLFSHDEVRRIKYIVPFGERMHDIVCYLGYLARAFVMMQRSKRKDKFGDPLCKSHLDVRVPALLELERDGSDLSAMYELLTSRAILFSLDTSRSRLSGATERLQMRRIYFPAFKAPVKRDVPIKLDTLDDIKSLLANPKTFVERELSKSGIGADQLQLALSTSSVKPREQA